MKPANDIARAFLLGPHGVHLCARGTCDCIAELTRLIEEDRAAVERSIRWRDRKLAIAKPRIAEALEEVRAKLKRA